MGGRKFIFEVQRFANISNSTNSTLVSGTNENDSITNSGRNVTLNAGAGDDTVTNSGDSSRIDLGDGNDSIYSEDEDNSTISGGAGKLATSC